MTASTYYSDDLVTLYHGDCLEVLRELPDESVHAVVTDPPYGLEFMGKDWDAPWKGSAASHADARVRRAAEMDDPVKGKFIRAGVNAYEAGKPFQAWCERWATECLRVLKPGGHLLAFGGTRTYHRLACAIEDSGFEIRDSIAWLYASGFPKSLDVSKAIDKGEGHWRGKAGAVSGRWHGWGTALKPAFEPIVVARKPLVGTVATNVLEHGTGALNIDGCRVAMTEADAAAIDAKHAGMDPDAYERPPGVSLHLSTDPMRLVRARAHELGRWPANVVLDDTQAAELDRQSGVSVIRRAPMSMPKSPGFAGSTYGNDSSERGAVMERGYDDQGGASRFFPTFRYEAKAPTSERPRDGGVAHPTVKPLDLMRWLVRLVTPPGGMVLEPFAGSGTTAEACILEGFRCIAIEREEDYLPLIVSRLSKPLAPALDLGGLL